MKKEQNMANCMLNLKKISTALEVYNETYHMLPDSNDTESLMTVLKLKENIFHSCTNIPFYKTIVYRRCKNGWKTGTYPEPILWDKIGKHDNFLHVLYSDGVVRVLNSDTIFQSTVLE